MKVILEMLSYPFLVRALVVGVLVSLCASLLGVPLVLKRYSMIGDGLSHVGFGALAIATAEREGAVLGYIHGQPYRTLYHAPVANVLALSVAQDAQGFGVGRALLARLEDWARAAGFSGVRLSSGMERAGAHVFYERCGYRHVKSHKTFQRAF